MPPAACKGCGKKFSSSKFRRSHLSQTTDPRCQSERQIFLSRRLLDYSPPLSPSQPASSPSDPSSSPLASPGNPTPTPPDNFAGTPAWRSPEIEDDGTLDLSDNVLDLSDGALDLDDGALDLDEISASDDENETQSDDDADSDTGGTNDNEHGRFLSAEEINNLQSKIWGDVHVEVYPGPYAGAVHSHGIPTTKELENMLGGPSPNPFAPFNNQTDWELAKWAKLRGPGSTSFTELMGVTGVCIAILYSVHY